MCSFKELGFDIVISDITNKKIIEDGIKIANDEACLSLKIYLGHIINLKDKCDYILVPRLFSIQKNEQVCTNFNALYDIVHNLIDVNILNYNIDLTNRETKLIAFLSLGESLGKSYISTYKAYKKAEIYEKKCRREREIQQIEKLKEKKIKILLAGHPYNLYDAMIGEDVIKFLKNENVEIIYSDRIERRLIESECKKISTDIHFSHNKEILASINYYQDKVDGIIVLSSFPCGIDALCLEMVIHKIKNIPVINLIFDDLSSNTGIITRLESFVDILKNIGGLDEKSN